MTEIILVMNEHMTKSYRKLMYGQQTYQNVHFSSFRQQIELAIGQRFICFFFGSEAEKKLFRINFDGSVEKQDYFFRPDANTISFVCSGMHTVLCARYNLYRLILDSIFRDINSCSGFPCSILVSFQLFFL